MGTTIVHLPDPLLSKVQNMANAEHRSIEDVLTDAVEQYAGVWSWEKLIAYGAERAKSLGLTESDVDRLIAEVRTERHRL